MDSYSQSDEKDKTDEQGIKEQAEKRKYKQLTKEEQEEANKQTEYKTGALIRLIRIIRDNPDLLVLGIIVLAFCIGGYWLAKIHLGLTTDQIKLQVWDFIEFVGIILVGVGALIGKLFVAQGSITKSLSKSATKEADVSGRTLIR